jgi:hypothetical protein
VAKHLIDTDRYINLLRTGETLPIIFLIALIAAGCASKAVQPKIAAEYGLVPGQRTEDGFRPESGYQPGVFAVSSAEQQLIAFDTHSAQTAICSRIDQKPFELPNHFNSYFYRFQCQGSWTSRDAILVNSTKILPTRGEQVEWKGLEGESPLAFSNSARPANLHSYAAVASPKLLNGRVLVSAAWFSGEYPPRKEYDESRGDEIAFGHYRILKRVLFIGQSVKQAATFLYRSDEVRDVKSGLEWAFLPENASEKTRSQFDAIYETPTGYLVRIAEWSDHEGFGVNETTHLYAYESGRWKFVASAERTRLY